MAQRMGRRRAEIVLLGVVVLTAALGLAILPGSTTAGRAHVANLSIDAIKAVFSEVDRSTTYSVVVHESDATATLGYEWKLTLEAVDPNVGVDEDCDNHGILSGTAPTFVWHHGNKADPVHDDDCDHDLQGKYGHQGTIGLTVTDSAGIRCSETYKGTLDSDAAAAAGLAPASGAQCVIPDEPPPAVPPPPPSPPAAPPPPGPRKPCKCILLTARIVPSSFQVETYGNKGEVRLDFNIHWTLNCLKGFGPRCRGTLAMNAPRIGHSLLFINGLPRVTVRCNGRCSGLSDGTFEAHLHGFKSRDDLAELRVPVVLRRTCQGKKLAPVRLSLAFDRLGRPDREKSKLR
jgi:hypothetical protein